MSQRATVLVVDDDPDTVETMREILQEEGHTVLSAKNGREGLDMACATCRTSSCSTSRCP